MVAMIQQLFWATACFLALGIQDISGAPDNGRCYMPIDIVWAIDVSSSIGEQQFNHRQEILSNFMSNYFAVGVKAIQFAAMWFNHENGVIFDFDDLESVEDMASAIKSLQYKQGDTYVANALNVARKLFVRTRGARKPQDAKQLVIVVTDGNSNNRQRMLAVANSLKDRGIRIIAIATGNAQNVPELQEMATQSSDVILNFDSLKEEQLVDLMLDKICSDVPAAGEDSSTTPSPTETSQPPVDITTSGSSNTTDSADQSTPEDTGDLSDDQIPDCNKTVSVVFVCDSSTSVGRSNFEIEKTFVKDLAGSFLNSGLTEIGAISFGGTVVRSFDLLSFSSKAELFNKIQNQIIFMGGSTRTGEALAQAAAMLSNSGNATNKFVILLTDGSSDNPNFTTARATVLKDGYMATIITVGIGSNVNSQEVISVASSEALAFQVGGFDTLSSIAAEVSSATCQQAQ